jgi:hypothetical protein
VEAGDLPGALDGLAGGGVDLGGRHQAALFFG